MAGAPASAGVPVELRDHAPRQASFEAASISGS